MFVNFGYKRQIRLFFAGILTTVLCCGELTVVAQNEGKNEQEPLKYAIALHGGAGSAPSMFTEDANRKRHASLEQALQIGVDILKNGGTSLDAVEKVVLFLEADPQFNAGVGAVFNAAGSHELDASIMDGKTLNCGAVAGVSRVKSPISLARLVMTDTPHVLLIGKGAEDFAEKMKVEMVTPDYFDTPKTREAWEKTRAKQKNSQYKSNLKPERLAEDIGSYQGTVGCVALDSHGNLAAATSTGGMSNKQYGRVGDSPIIGAGTYADNKTVAVSCTGTGEQYIRHAIAYDIAAQVKYKGVDVDTAVKNVLEKTLDPDDGGLIAVSRLGQVSARYNTEGMGSGIADSTGRFEINWDIKQSKKE